MLKRRRGGGLNRYLPESGAFTHYTEADGQPNNTIYGILEDDLGRLWLSTNLGIAVFDPQSGAVEAYNQRDGLQSNEFNQGAYYRNVHGEMFFGGVNGLNAFYPDRIQDSSYVPPIVLTSLTQGREQVVLDKGIEQVRQVTFRWPINLFEFEFAALSFSQPDKNQYAYKLEGFDKDWNLLETRRYAHLARSES